MMRHRRTRLADKSRCLVGGILLSVAIAGVVSAAAPTDDIWTRDSLTHGFGGLTDALADKGFDFAVGLTTIYQHNARGGASTKNRAGRMTGSYDIELGIDLATVLGFEGATFYLHGGGSWPRSDADTASIGSYFGANADAGGRRALDLLEAYFEQSFFEDTLAVRIGKFDITGGFECRGCPVSFDGNAYANDETAQFLNGALVNNPTIPFPDYGLGAVIYWNPVEYWYASAALMDAEADGRETGFSTTFSRGDNTLFAVFETGVTPQFDSKNGPLQGAYRIGVWLDPQNKAHSDTTKTYGQDLGWYISIDQVLCKENADSEDTQGLGLFGRYGYANDLRNDLTDFWSFGLQYQGLFDGRDDDVLGVGYAHGSFSDRASTTYPEDYESVLETYYNIQLTPWLNISPSIQYITNPGGAVGVSDAVVFGVRAQCLF